LENTTTDYFNYGYSQFEYSMTAKTSDTTKEVADSCTNIQEEYEDNDNLAQKLKEQFEKITSLATQSTGSFGKKLYNHCQLKWEI